MSSPTAMSSQLEMKDWNNFQNDCDDETYNWHQADFETPNCVSRQLSAAERKSLHDRVSELVKNIQNVDSALRSQKYSKDWDMIVEEILKNLNTLDPFLLKAFGPSGWVCFHACSDFYHLKRAWDKLFVGLGEDSEICEEERNIAMCALAMAHSLTECNKWYLYIQKNLLESEDAKEYAILAVTDLASDTEFDYLTLDSWKQLLLSGESPQVEEVNKMIEETYIRCYKHAHE